MRPFRVVPILLLSSVLVAPGCAAVEGIFKAGVWVGLVVAVFLVGLALALFSWMRG